jgi:hypothetical protein
VAAEPLVAQDCAAPWAAELGPGFKIVCGSAVLRQLWDNDAKLWGRLGAALSGPEWRAISDDTTPAKLVEACGAVASPEVEGCYATRLTAEGARLRQLLGDETRFSDDP